MTWFDLRRNRRRAWRHLQRALFEAFPPRLLFAVFTWTGADVADPTDFNSNGNWQDQNGNPGVPHNGDDVQFSSAGDYTHGPIKLNGGIPWSVDSIYVGNVSFTLDLNSDSLTVSSILDINSTPYTSTSGLVVENTGVVPVSILVLGSLHLATDDGSSAELDVTGANAGLGVWDEARIGTGDAASGWLNVLNGAKVQFTSNNNVDSVLGSEDCNNAWIAVTSGILTTTGLTITKGNEGSGVYISGANSGWNTRNNVTKANDGVIVDFSDGGQLLGAGSFGGFSGGGLAFGWGLIHPGDDDDLLSSLSMESDLTLDSGDAVLEVLLETGGGNSGLGVTGAVSLGALEGSIQGWKLGSDTDDYAFGASYTILTADSMSANFTDYGGGGDSPSWGEPLTAYQAAYLPGLPIVEAGEGNYRQLVWELERVEENNQVELVLSVAYGDYVYGGYSRAGNSVTLSESVSAPTIVFASRPAGGGIHVSWDDTNGSETGYEIQRRTDDGEWTIVHTAPTNVIGWVDTEVSHGYAYTYRVRAIGDDERYSDWTEVEAAILY